VFSALAVLAAATTQAQPSVRALLFTSPSCPHCRVVREQTLPPLLAHYDKALSITVVDTSTPTGQRLYQAAGLQLGFKPRGVPMLIIGRTALIGTEEIPARLPGLVDKHLLLGGLDWPEIAGLAA